MSNDKELSNILKDGWGFAITPCVKRYDGDWHLRYVWKAKNGDHDGAERLECDWHGYAYPSGAIKNMIKTIKNHK